MLIVSAPSNLQDKKHIFANTTIIYKGNIHLSSVIFSPLYRIAEVYKFFYAVYKRTFINKHYDWSTETKHHAIPNAPDRRLFDRLNGNQILYLINFFGYSVGNLTIADGQRIEDLIIESNYRQN